jgi:hypothetical protein
MLFSFATHVLKSRISHSKFVGSYLFVIWELMEEWAVFMSQSISLSDFILSKRSGNQPAGTWAIIGTYAQGYAAANKTTFGRD